MNVHRRPQLPPMQPLPPEETTYGALMRITEGNGTSAIYETIASLRAALSDRDRQLAELRRAAELVMGDPANVKMRDKLRAALLPTDPNAKEDDRGAKE